MFFEFTRIVREVREASGGRFPEFVVLENVPGLFSAAGGRDFGVILNDLAECGTVDIAWRVIDSQHWVPQRRRRVFIVASFAPAPEPDSPIGRSSQILALAEGCGGHSSQGRAAGEGAAGEAGDGLAKPLGGGSGERGWMNDLDNATYVPMLAPTLDTNLGTKQWLGDQDVENYGLMMDAIAVRTANTNANGHGVADDVAHTLDGVNGQAVAFATSGLDSPRDDGLAPPVKANLNGQGTGSGPSVFAAIGASVRRLTPTECLRLQGFPDDWLDLDPPLADGPKYRMTGNAVTVPVLEWIGRRIMAAQE